MLKRLLFPLAVLALMSCSPGAPDARVVLEKVAQAMGASGLKSIRYSGSGSYFRLGQGYKVGGPWALYNAKRYTRWVDYGDASLQEELIRTRPEGPRWGGRVMRREARQVRLVRGDYAWNLSGASGTAVPVLTGVAERRLEIWLTPHGFIQAAMTRNPVVEFQTVEGSKETVVTFTVDGKYDVKGIINEQNLVARVETAVGNTVLGDMRVETSYSGYRDFSGVQFPTRIVRKEGGFPTLEITVDEVQPNAAFQIETPENVREAVPAPLQVKTEKLDDGIWVLVGAGSRYNSVAVEFKDHVVLIEPFQDEERSIAVMAEVKRLVPGKPIRYLVNTHHHFDHSAGIRPYVAEGATIITHYLNRAFYTRVLKAPWTLLPPDSLSQSGKEAKFETVTDEHVLTDGVRTMEFYALQGNQHDEGSIVVYLPEEKMLIEGDAFAAFPPGAPAPDIIDPFTVNLYENIQRLGLEVNRIVPLHGRAVPYGEMLKAIGKG